ncbi:putative sphingolipid transporter spinster-like protein 1 [Diplonema papillatum]|nr:putative sphingolipid transporter spinster-like protein 1 [Diplonema papillatum]|eukprot:gene21506-33090_t
MGTGEPYDEETAKGTVSNEPYADNGNHTPEDNDNEGNMVAGGVENLPVLQINGKAAEDVDEEKPIDETPKEGKPKKAGAPALTEEQLAAFPMAHRRLMCALILVTRIAAHYDGGALAALIGDEEKRMANDMDLTKTEQGLLVSLGYIGLIMGSLISGTMLQRFDAKRTLRASLVLLSIGIGVFAASPNGIVLQITRPVIGVGQALLTVFYPVWVDEYAPPGSASAYMGVLQAGGPLGTVVGFLVAGFMMANTSASWRWVFFVQGVLIAPCILALFFIPARYMDLRPKEGEKIGAVMSGLRSILKDGMIWFATLSLSSLYFVVTGLQTWVADYVTDDDTPVTAGSNTVVATFGFTAATAPVSGIIIGGIILIKTGGYRGKDGSYSTAYVGLILGCLAAAFAWAAIFMTTFVGFMICVWFLLFFGGGMVPGLVGLVVTSVDKQYRGLCSGFTAVVQNTLGYALGPLAAGVVADASGIKWGFRLVLAWSAVALFFQVLVVTLAKKRQFTGEVGPVAKGEGEKSDVGSQFSVRTEGDSDSSTDVFSRSLMNASFMFHGAPAAFAASAIIVTNNLPLPDVAPSPVERRASSFAREPIF